MPSRASSSGGVDRADQNAACELNPNSESPQALPRVRARTFRGRRRTGPATVGTGPVPSGCQGIVVSAGDDAAGPGTASSGTSWPWGLSGSVTGPTASSCLDGSPVGAVAVSYTH